MSPITLWFRWVKDKEHPDGWFSFNHLEDGHSETDKPVPKFPSQNGWLNSIWKREHSLLSDGKVIHG